MPVTELRNIDLKAHHFKAQIASWVTVASTQRVPASPMDGAQMGIAAWSLRSPRREGAPERRAENDVCRGGTGFVAIGG